MTVPVVLAIAGVVALFLSVLGGGIKAKEVEIPPAPPKGRLIVGLIGIVLIGISIWLSLSTPNNGQQPTLGNVPATPESITIILTNNNCSALDYYIDGELVFSPIEAGSTLSFSTTSGKHLDYTCLPGTTTCGKSNTFEWVTSTTHSIERSSQCPITIILTNKNCQPLDYYVDGELVFSPIEAGSTLSFSTTSGKHLDYTCLPGTTTCGKSNTFEWVTSTTHSIASSSQCP